MTGIERIAAERKRQIEVEGYTAQHDDLWKKGELADAAASYALDRTHYTWMDLRCTFWPWNKKQFKLGKDRIQELEKAGALIAAEIDRLQRMGEKAIDD